MRKILVIGAGLSSSYLIKYLLKHANKENWEITIADANERLAKEKIGKSERAKAKRLDVLDTESRKRLISQHDLVISLLPASLHILVAADCLALKKHLITASYISEEMKQMDSEVKSKGLLFLNEIGLDPGIDHMSAMEMIHSIQQKGAEIESFKSYCGGLVSPEFDTNPWHYKFTWNPRNVVVAGQATARYLQDGRLRFIPASRIFTETETVRLKTLGVYESYANRDSLEYIDAYGIQNASTVLRGTLRKKGYSASWNQFVRLGLTDDGFTIPGSEQLSYRSLLAAFVPGATENTLEQDVCRFLGISKQSSAYKNLQWLGVFEDTKAGLKNASPAKLLQHLLEDKWKLGEHELDMIVMKHEIRYRIGNKTKTEVAELVVKGEDKTYTAMSKTVGLPMAIAARLFLTNKIQATGVIRPVNKEIYIPVLKELKKYGIEFKHY